MFEIKFNRTTETILGVGLPLLILALFEVYYYVAKKEDRRSFYFLTTAPKTMDENIIKDHHQEAQRQNIFGIRVITVAACFVGIGVSILGFLSAGRPEVMLVGGGIFLTSTVAFYKSW